MYYDDGADIFLGFLYVIMIIGFVVGMIALAVRSDEKERLHETDMRSQYAQCVKENKEWVLTEKYGIDGICVSKR